MLDMPRPRKPYVQREKTRHDKTVWYFRKGAGPRIRLRGDYESAEWLADYEAASGVRETAPTTRATNGTLAWLIDRYYGSTAFAGLADGTQRARRSILNRVKDSAGNWTIQQVTQKRIAEGRDARSASPFAAVSFVKAMKGLFAWAVEAQHVAENPAAGVKARAPRTEGHHTWTVDEVRRFQKVHPVGTRARLALDILLYTGMRRADAVLFGRQHVRHGIIRFRAGKNNVDVTLPLLEPLERSIAATPTGDLAFLVTERGRPMTAAGFGNWFRDMCVEAGVPGRAHGLRKAGATIAAENGATELQLMALWGWTDPKQAAVYTRKARREVLAEAAAERLHLDGSGTSIPAPFDPIPAPRKKA
jgi:integrase